MQDNQLDNQPNHNQNQSRLPLVITIICAVAATAISFVVGFSLGNSNKEVSLIRPLKEIDEWEVSKMTTEGGETIYQSTGLSYIPDDQQEGWHELLHQLAIVCHPKDPDIIDHGNTTHIGYDIIMKNGDTYKIVWVGNRNQTDITLPDGTTYEYQCYYSE